MSGLVKLALNVAALLFLGFVAFWVLIFIAVMLAA